MALTKTIEAVDAWAEIVQGAGGIREGATIDVSPNYETILHIDACLSETGAETAGATIIVQGSSNTSGDADWTPITVLSGPTGSAESEALSVDKAAGQTVLGVTNPTTNNLDNPSRYIFFEDTVDPTKSEIVFQITNEGDAGGTITILDGLTNAHTAAGSLMWFIDSATAPNTCVVQYNINIPMGFSRVRVVYDNTHSTTANIFTRARISKVTSI